MKGDPKTIELLNEALKEELTAINQYWLHYRILDDLLGEILATAALELAAHRAVRSLGIAMPALRRGANVGLSNQVARTDDHGRNMTLMRTIRKMSPEITARWTSKPGKSLRAWREGR